MLITLTNICILTIYTNKIFIIEKIIDNIFMLNLNFIDRSQL